MAAKWKCPEKLILQDWISKSQKAKSVTEWELDFLYSISSQLRYKDELSRDQVEILERIYSEKTS